MTLENECVGIDLEKFEEGLWKYLSKQDIFNEEEDCLCPPDRDPAKDCKRIHLGIIRLAKRARYIVQ